VVKLRVKGQNPPNDYIDKTMPNDTEEIIAPEVDTETTENIEEDIELEEVEEEDVQDLKKRLATAEAQKEHWRKKALTEKQQKPAPTQATTFPNLSPGDLVAISNAKINEEDMDRVARFAQSEGLTIREALKNPEMKAILSLREEMRTTAIATNVEGVRRGSVKLNDDALLYNAQSGKLPTSDDDIERLIALKIRHK
jgi:ribosomal protein L19